MITDRVLTAVCRHGGIARAELLSPARQAPVVRARQIAALLLRERTGQSYPRIARWLQRDHTTVLHGVRQARRLKDTDPAFRALYDACNRTLDADAPAPPVLGSAPPTRRRAARRPAQKARPVPAADAHTGLRHHADDSPEDRATREAFARRDRRFLAALQAEHGEPTP